MSYFCCEIITFLKKKKNCITKKLYNYDLKIMNIYIKINIKINTERISSNR